MKYFLILFCLLFAQPALAGNWDKTDKILFGSGIVLAGIDYFQTRAVLDEPDRFYELNPIIRHYGENSLIPYFVVRIGLEYLIADRLNSRHRKLFLGVVSSIQLINVGHNYSVGVRIKF